MTDACEHDCHFCPLRASAPRRRTAFEPAELARLFGTLHDAGKVDGLFLSSAVAGTPDATMDRMLSAVEILRTREGFDGYIHLKLLPGASDGAVEAAARLASRVSINVEVPSGAYLNALGTGKDMLRDILRPMRLLHRMEQAGHLPSGLSTQYVVGAAGETDREIVSSVRWLSEEMGLRRAYFGLFRPAPGTPLEHSAATHEQRPARLYQADWLTRVYGLSHDDVSDAFDAGGNLPLGVDPKVAVALARPERFPLDVNVATYDELLRVPGIGPISAQRIVSLREGHSFSDVSQLKRAGVAVGRAAPFILIGGRQPEDAAKQRARLTRQRNARPEQFGTQLPLPGFE
jgi:predicted DNA-binding helix-hairpin-helix protein